MMTPLEVLEAPEDQVWLTGAFGFTPSDWGYLSFTDKGRRDYVLKETQPGFLAVIYGSTNKLVRQTERRKILGIVQCSHVAGIASDYLSREGHARWEEIRTSPNSWKFAIQLLRAWKVCEESRPYVKDFATDTYRPEKGRSISRYSAKLTAHEAQKLRDLEIIEIDVFNIRPRFQSGVGQAKDIFARPYDY
ncbi:hypothetical protein [Pararhizobium sp. IMCC21322]|uniref:hypothetical protein n=1 Tax=Pararhizobium sp. IMCC21322 TaxID=3067903 RepID=UPI00274257A0|nr:hypothetical protein [Pararhizobium sp. IMCC21322]